MKKDFYLIFILVLFLGACSSEHSPGLTDIGSEGGVSGSGSSRCANRIKGRWDFGETPYGCAMPVQATQKAEAEYQEYIYDPSVHDSDAEKKRYVKAMNAYITETSQQYLLRREPDIINAEMDAWVHLVRTIAHQESYWTHYRMGEDGIIRLLKGDNYHGYGMMQIDDRWHKDFIKSQEVYDLSSHIIYALDLMYSIRKKVKAKPCGSATDYDQINRSIYSAYNGGLGSKCRWKNPGHKWAKNDKGFLAKYIGRIWEKFLDLISRQEKEKETPEPKEESKIENDSKVAQEEDVAPEEFQQEKENPIEEEENVLSEESENPEVVEEVNHEV